MHRSIFHLHQGVSDIRFCPCHQVEYTQVGPVEWSSLYVQIRERDLPCLLVLSEEVPPESGDRIQTPKMLFYIKYRIVVIVQNRDS
jgi:hypothetical protein